MKRVSPLYSRICRWLMLVMAGCLISGISFGQITVTGVLSDGDTGDPLPGATVVEQGTTNGSVTNLDGAYSITVANADAVLVFSFVGYETMTVPVGQQTTINMGLSPSTTALDEVVVIGYGQTLRKNITGAISSVKSESIERLPVAGFDEAIQGKLAGVRVINSNAAPGGGFDIQIRGVGTLTSSGFPLIVVDGMPLPDEEYRDDQNPFNLINPNDIESIEVLKDASSAAIYGARSSNGVILVTTKKGQRGKANINFSMTHGMTQYINEPEMGTAEQWIKWQDDMSRHQYTKMDPGNWNPDLEPSWGWNDDLATRNANVQAEGNIITNDWRMWDYHAYDPAVNSAEKIAQFESYENRTAYLFDDYTDWRKVIARDSDYPGRKSSYNLSASGGNERARYYISGSYYKDKGIIRKTDYERYTANINVDFKVTDWATVGAKIAPSWQDMNTIIGGAVEHRWYADPLYQLVLRIPPILPVYNEDGTPAVYGRGSEWNQLYNNWGTEFFANPILLFEADDNRKTFRALSNFFTEFQLTEGLKFRSSLLTDFENGYAYTWKPSTYGNRFQNPGPHNFHPDDNVRSEHDLNRRQKFYWENLLTYNKTFADRHNLNLIAGYTLENTESLAMHLRKEGYVTDEVFHANAGSVVGDQIDDATTNASRNAFIGLFSRLTYNFDSKYYLTAAVRRDGSSRFGAESLWGVFPSVSLAWRVSAEPFMQGLTWLDDMKLRASFGSTGNSGIPSLKQQRVIGIQSYLINMTSATGFVDASLYDPGLSWEKTKEVNVGLDIALFTNGRVILSADAYRKNTTDMLLSVAMPEYSGFGSILQNFGEMQNTGIEATINAVPVTGTFFWETGFNVAHNQNEIISMFQNPDVRIEGQRVAGLTSNTVGYVGGPISVFWGNIWDGIYNDWDEVYNTPRDWSYTTDHFRMRERSNAPGEFKYVDVNGDGRVTGDDATVIGNPWPDAFFGWTNTFRWKGFDLYLHLEGTTGVEVYNIVKYEWFRQAKRGFNMPKSFLDDYWTPDNPDAKYGIIGARRSVNSKRMRGTLIVEDGDFIALRSCRLGYTFPSSISQKLLMRQLRIYVNMYNALYFTKYEGFNPEGNNRGQEDIERSRNFGVDGGNYPLSRTITFGIDVGF